MCHYNRFKRFNSTLVQLKVANRRKGSASSFSFNSTLVQLKVTQPGLFLYFIV